MGITTSTMYGRAEISHPDFGHDGGSALHTKIVNSIAQISDDLAVRWKGANTLADTVSMNYKHSFNMLLANITVVILESGVPVSVPYQEANYLVTQIDANNITIQNISGASKTFDFYVFGFSFDAMLGKKKAKIPTTDATVTTLASLTIPVGTAAIITATVAARKDGSIENIYELKYACNNNAGTVSVAQMSKTQLEDDTDWDCNLDASGDTVRVRVTGEAATNIVWTASIESNYL